MIHDDLQLYFSKKLSNIHFSNIHKNSCPVFLKLCIISTKFIFKKKRKRMIRILFITIH